MCSSIGLLFSTMIVTDITRHAIGRGRTMAAVRQEIWAKREPITIPVRKLSVYLQLFSRKTDKQRWNNDRHLRGYRSLMPSCAGFLEPRKSRLGSSKSTFNAENFTCSFSMSISTGFSAIRSWKMSRSPKSPKIHKNPFFSVHGHSRSLNSVAIESQCTTSY